MFINENQKNQIQILMDMCYKIYSQYKWLLDSYVADFYVDNCWKKLPLSWTNSLNQIKPAVIANIIDPFSELHSFQPLPLSLLSLRQCIKYLSIQRKQQLMNIVPNFQGHSMKSQKVFSISHFKNTFWKRVKLKKRHEIKIMAKACYKLAEKTNCKYIIDVGSGAGHLSRLLSYIYDFKVCSLEANEYLVNQAIKLDEDIQKLIRKYYNIELEGISNPIYLNIKIKTCSDGYDIFKAVKEAFCFKTENFQFGIVGLHPCGDLGPTLLKLFINCPQVKFINVIGCCYMKLSKVYCIKAVSNMNIHFDITELESREIEDDLAIWENVVIFYSLRLMMAPLIETIIMLDRILFILESGSEAEVSVLFDPNISPRNQALATVKRHLSKF